MRAIMTTFFRKSAIITATVLAAAGATGGIAQASTGQAPADHATAAVQPPPGAIRVAMTKVSTAKSGATPDGSGDTYGDCGYSYLFTYPSSNSIEIYLESTLGNITGGYWTATTDGLYSLSIAGGIPNAHAPYWSEPATFADSGLWPDNATAYGLVYTQGGTCYFSVTAPWT